MARALKLSTGTYATSGNKSLADADTSTRCYFDNVRRIESPSGTVSVTGVLDFFLSAADRTAGKEPFYQMEKTVTGADYTTYFSDSALNTVNQNITERMEEWFLAEDSDGSRFEVA